MSSLLPEDGEHLATGWEPDLAAADSLVRQAVLAHASWAVTLARCADRPWADGPEWAAGYCTDRGFMANWVVFKQPQLDLRRAVADVDDLFPDGVGYIVVSPWPTPDLGQHRLALVGHPPLMFRPTTAATEPPTTDLDVRWVSNTAELHDAERVLVEGYPLPELQPFAPGAVYPEALVDGTTRVVVAYDGATPLATAAAHSANGVTLVENVAVMAASRGRGAGAAVTWAATSAVRDQPAVLIASDDGQPVYERLDYLRVERWTVWLRSPTSRR